MRQDRSKFLERLAIYLAGVAIGLTLLGFLYMQRQGARSALEQRRAEQAAAAQAAAAQQASPPPADPQGR